jgi:hypothetical protein
MSCEGVTVTSWKFGQGEAQCWVAGCSGWVVRAAANRCGMAAGERSSTGSAAAGEHSNKGGGCREGEPRNGDEQRATHVR